MSNDNLLVFGNGEDADDSSPVGTGFFKPGINSGVRLIKFEHVGGAKEYLNIVFQKGDRNIEDRIYPVDPAFVESASWMKKQKAELDDEAYEALLKRTVTKRKMDINDKLKSIVIDFTTEEKFAEQQAKLAPKVTTFKSLCNFFAGFLPPGFDEKEGFLMLWYKNNTFLGVPPQLTSTGNVFSLHEDHMKVSTNEYFQERLIKPAKPSGNNGDGNAKESKPDVASEQSGPESPEGEPDTEDSEWDVEA